MLPYYGRETAQTLALANMVGRRSCHRCSTCASRALNGTFKNGDSDTCHPFRLRPYRNLGAISRFPFIHCVPAFQSNGPALSAPMPRRRHSYASSFVPYIPRHELHLCRTTRLRKYRIVDGCCWRIDKAGRVPLKSACFLLAAFEDVGHCLCFTLLLHARLGSSP